MTKTTILTYNEFIGIKKYGTHNKESHPDDIGGGGFILLTNPKAEFIRTRCEETLSQVKLSFDVGCNRYDHHHPEKEIRPNGVPYGSFGLLWRDFGKGLLQHEYEIDSQEDIDEIHAFFDFYFVQGIDALDNGKMIHHYFLDGVRTELVSLAKAWYNMNPIGTNISDEEYNEAYLKAIHRAKEDIHNFLIRVVNAYKLYKQKVKTAFENMNDGIIIFDEDVDWELILFNIDKNKQAKFIVMPSHHGGYMTRCVPTEFEGMSARVPFPKDWGGLRNEEFSKASGIPDGVFCFFGGEFFSLSNSKKSAITLAQKALNQ